MSRILGDVSLRCAAAAANLTKSCRQCQQEGRWKRRGCRDLRADGFRISARKTMLPAHRPKVAR
jgi:hypothetical protein